MGCNSSAVVPLGDSDVEDSTGIKVRVNSSTPERKASSAAARRNGRSLVVRKTSQAALESSEPPEEFLTKDFNLEQRVPPPPPLAFEIPLHENGDSIIRKHPPKRFRRLEENQRESKDLTHEWIEEKQMEAEARRNELMMMRMKSANHGNQRHNRRLVHSDAFNHGSEEADSDKNLDDLPPQR